VADIDGDGTNQEWAYVKALADGTGGLAGVAASNCAATGVGSAQDQLRTVGPCVGTHGQSVF
jgi:hypothetical protein